eukprot:TRINITY_DN3439_c0_g1_i1.p1 TRINITY_DN3439_c0_g1~~TRINITY_DN3439_c0_g1_i1.p1  ORF type:complete len:960 (-),score=222.62 TRINITY_DN3439_c0_g1_i1:198-3077(-)
MKHWELLIFSSTCFFLVIKSIPLKTSFFQFVEKLEGGTNAYTSEQNTNYYFDINSNYLRDALDRFGNFFIAPLLTESSSAREVKAVNSEYSKNLRVDDWRYYATLQATSNPAYPYSKFSTGSFETLIDIPKAKGINIRDHLVNFHKKYYSANIMTLAVLGKESLQELEKLVMEIFEKVPNTNAQVPVYTEPFFLPQHFGKEVKIVPIKNSKILFLYFQLPDETAHRSFHPLNYICRFLGDEASGSILSYLRKQGWADSLSCGEEHSGAKFSIMEVRIMLTDEGFDKRIDDIIEAFFNYVNLLKNGINDEWRYEEHRALAQINFDWMEKLSVSSLVSSISKNMMYYSGEDGIAGPYLYKEWDSSTAQMLSTMLDNISPDKLRIHTVSPKYAEEPNLITEHYFGVRYLYQNIDASRLQKWKNPKNNPNLYLPKRNDFSPKDLAVAPYEKMKYPKNLTLSADLEIFHQSESLRPKSYTFVLIRSPYVYANPQNYVASFFYLRLVEHMLDEVEFEAQSAGSSFSFDLRNEGIEMRFSVFKEKASLLMEKIAHALKEPIFDEQYFEIVKTEKKEAFENQKLDQPYKRIRVVANQILRSPYWSPEELLPALLKTKLSDVQDAAKSIFKLFRLQVYVVGNVPESESYRIANFWKDSFVSSPLPSALDYNQRIVVIPPGSNFVHDKSLAQYKEPNSAIFVNFQVGIIDSISRVKLQLMANMINGEFFKQLRTKQQLGYVVSSGTSEYLGVADFLFLIQSGRDPVYLDGRIEDFLNQALKTLLQQITDQEFQTYVSALSTAKASKKPEDLRGFYWSEILSGRAAFDLDMVESELLSKIRKEEVIQFVSDVLLSRNRRKLSIHFRGLNSSDSGVVESPEVRLIHDINSFKLRSAFYGIYIKSPPPLIFPSTAKHEMQETHTGMLTAIILLVIALIFAVGFIVVSRYLRISPRKSDVQFEELNLADHEDT